MQSLVDLARDTIRRHAMLAGGEVVLVAVSGGADSVALLHVLHDLAPALGLSLHVAHVDHRLRPESSRDAEFVVGLARSLGVPVTVLGVDVARRGSLEAAARLARYAALDTHADRIGASRVAVGHTADDQAETVMMRLLEGTGSRGLAGIPPVRGRIIRPLLDARRIEIVGALEARGIAWIEDPSNADPRFLRNRVRHEILPRFGAYREDVVRALTRTARVARVTVDVVARMAAAEVDRAAVVDGDAIALHLDRLQALPERIAAEVLRQCAARLGSRAPLRAWAYRGLARVLAAPAPRRAFRLGGIRVDVSAGRVRLARGATARLTPRALAIPGTTALPELGLALDAVLVDATTYDVPRGRRVVAFDADVLPSSLVVRGRRRGDRFVAFGGSERRIKQLLIGAKVPRWQRDAVPIIEAAGTIVWVAGYRRAAAAPVTRHTRRVLELALVALADTTVAR